MNYNSEIIKDWSSLGYFRRFTPQKYYAVCGCFIIGFELSTVRCEGFYRTYFVMYPLWEKTVKECFRYPYIFKCIDNKNGLDLEIPFKDHHVHFIKSIADIKRDLSFLFRGDLSAKEMYIYLERLATDMEFHYRPVIQAYILVAELYLSIFVNDKKKDNDILNKIIKKSMDWDLNNFRYWGNFDEWYKEILSLKDKREEILKQIETNINSEKLRKLPRYNLIP